MDWENENAIVCYVHLLLCCAFVPCVNTRYVYCEVIDIRKFYCESIIR